MIERYESVEPVGAQWDALAERCRARPWLRPGWFIPWWTQFGRGAMAVYCLRRHGRLVAVAPLSARAAVRTSLANWHTPEFGLLAETDSDREELAAGLLQGRLRRFELRFVDRDDPGRAVWHAAARACGWRVIERTLESSPYLEIQGSWEEYARSRRGAFLADLRRRRRRLEERGAVAIEIADGTERLDALLDEGFAIEGSGWKTRQGTAIASRPETARFYREIARWAADCGWLRLAFLRVDGRAAAFQFNIVHAGVHFNLKGGYDPEYARFAPGRLLHRELIERAHSAGVRSYEFLGAAEPWKLEWTESTRDRQILQAFPRTAMGAADWAAYACGRPLARRALSWGSATAHGRRCR